MKKRWTNAITDIISDGQTAHYRFRVRGQSMAPTLQPGDEVIVERSSLGALHSGDLVLLQNGDQPLLHRFLGIRHRDGQKWLLTGGDRMRHLDPLWPEGALWGRAMTICRGDQSLPLPTGRSYAWRLRLRAALGAAAYRLGQVLTLVLALVLLAVDAGWASVTLVSFDAEWTGDQVHVTWETASEVDNIGFYVLRSDQEGGGYQRVTELLPSEGDLVGAVYEWIDSAAAPGVMYYYKLEDVSASGGSSFVGPVSPPATAAATATFTPTPEPAATATPLPSSTPTPTPTPLPSLTPTSSPTHTPPPSPSPSATATIPPTPTLPATATSTAPVTSTSLPTAEPSATASHTPLQPSATNTQMPSPEPSITSGPASGTPLTPPTPSSPTPSPLPSPAPPPSPTVTGMAVSMAAPSGGESGLAEEADSAPSPDSSDEEELARAKRRLTWSLIGIAGAIGGALLLIILVLIVFALYQWGFLRSG